MSEHKTNAFLRWKREEAVRDTSIYDRFAREIQPGDLVHLKGSEVMWEVQEVRPDMTPRNVLPDPRVPKNVQPVVLSLIAVSILTVAGGMPTTEIIKFRDLAEREADVQQRFAQPGGQPS